MQTLSVMPLSTHLCVSLLLLWPVQSPKKVGEDIQKGTLDWKGLRVTVKLTVINRVATVRMLAPAFGNHVGHAAWAVVAVSDWCFCPFLFSWFPSSCTPCGLPPPLPLGTRCTLAITTGGGCAVCVLADHQGPERANP
jgi:hypothetical protein